jgi:hypothetical protein
MDDNERDLDHLSPDEEVMAQRLTTRADLLRALEQAERELVPTFARTLRDHLVYGEELAPHPTFARRLRAHLLRRRGARPVPRPRRRRLPFGLGILAFLVAVMALAFVNLLPHQRAFPALYPTTADLLYNLPAPAGTLNHLGPTSSLVHPASAVPYPGKVRLHAPRLSSRATDMHAFQLASPRGVAQRGRVLLGIRSRLRRVRAAGSLWLVAADRGPATHRRLHSLAVSATTGELVYHDRRNFRLPRSRAPVRRGEAIRAARRWLTMLGWPGTAMPVETVGQVSGYPKVREVVFGWARAGRASIDEATLWVAPDRSIIEAFVWPPVARDGRVPGRSIANAWLDLVARKAPLVVERITGAAHGIATGTLRRVTNVLVLVPGHKGNAYLVPAYRFEGTLRIGSASVKRTWLSLVPVARR